MSTITSRFSEIIDNMYEYNFHILGCGAIGSSAATQLCRMGAESLFLYDFDTVGIENVGVSHYYSKDIGDKKVKALQRHLLAINEFAEVVAVDDRFERLSMYTEKDIVILGFDNMTSRLEAVENVLNNGPKPFLLIDGRMGSEHYQQYSFLSPTIAQYKKTWYSDESGDPEPCNAKATSYCSNMSGSFIANTVTKAITNKEVKKEIFFNFPSLVVASK
jgi:molybdopterin/thiamine biosynthesis adenylyltransferase